MHVRVTKASTRQRNLPQVVAASAIIAQFAGGLGGCAAATAGGVRQPNRSDSLVANVHLDGVLDDYWRYLQLSRPELAARANLAVRTLPDPTQDRTKKDAQFARAALVSLDEVYVNALTEDDYVTWLSLRWEMEAMAGWSAFHWNRLSDLTPGSSVFDRTISILKSQQITDQGAAQRYLGLVGAVTDLATALRNEYVERARRDIRLPRPLMARAITHVASLIAAPDSSPFRLPDAFMPSPDSAWQVVAAKAVADQIAHNVNPALDSLVRFLEGELASSSDSLGASRVPGGNTYYATILRYRTTLDISPEDAHAFGLREVARLAALTGEARTAAGLPVARDSLRAAFHGDSTFMFDERVSIPERAAQLFTAAVSDLDSLFALLPTQTLSIGGFAEKPTAPMATYEPASVQKHSATYMINVNRLVSHSAIVLPGMIIGDLMPGLHLQQGLQLENTALPAFRRLANNDGFVRGWQSYALDATDSLYTSLLPWQRFSLRLRELADACGLVVDTGINAIGWTREDALRFLRAYLPDDDADLERDFVLVAGESPGYLSAATLGARELRGLRRWAMRELGERFKLAAFHEEVLRVGSVPLPVLGSHIERWIWEQKQPAPGVKQPR